MIAQELKKTLPELVGKATVVKLAPGKAPKKSSHLTVDYLGLTGALVSGLNELASKFDKLEKS